MYAPFFGLSKEPFSIAPDPRFLFMSEMHREALAHLLYGLGGGGGFVLLTGEIGAGKTTVCRAFLEQLPAHCAVAYIFNPRLTATELLQTVCDEFGIPPVGANVVSAGGASVKQLVDALNAFLLQAHAQGRQAVLIIDEAQNLSAEVLEQLRLLTNLETAERKLLQIVLIGQPELRGLLARPELEQLAQRIIARYHLPALNAAETVRYTQHRWSVASLASGQRGDAGSLPLPLPFETAALGRIHGLTGGVPRRINLLCDRALLGAYAQGRARVDRATLEQAAREAFGSRPPTRRAAPRTLAAAAAVTAVLMLGGLAGWWTASTPLAAPGDVATGVAAAASATALAASPAGPALAVLPTAASPRATLPVAVAVAVAAADPAAVLAGAYRSEAIAWRVLGRQWGLAIGAGDPCLAAATAGVLCWRSASGLGVVRQLDRPGLLVLRDAAGQPLYAELVALSDERATLQADGLRWSLGLAALAAIWRGEFATFWRLPPGWRVPAESPQPPEALAWLRAQLDRAAPAAPGATLRTQVQAFQVAQGLVPDGVAGPLTLIQLSRAAGVDEPHLER